MNIYLVLSISAVFFLVFTLGMGAIIATLVDICSTLEVIAANLDNL